MELDYPRCPSRVMPQTWNMRANRRDEAGGTAWLVAKIERAEAVADDETLDGLIRASDAVMVARGDRGGDRRCRAGGHPEENHSARAPPQQGSDHRDTDDGVDDPELDADPRESPTWPTPSTTPMR